MRKPDLAMGAAAAAVGTLALAWAAAGSEDPGATTVAGVLLLLDAVARFSLARGG